MKKARRKVLLIFCLCLALFLAMAGGVTLALLKQASQPVVNEFSSGDVGCEIDETFNGTEKTSVKIKNTGTVPVYVRIKIVSYWINEDGVVVADAQPVPDFSLGEGWLDGGNGTYYYALPIEAGQKTGDLIASGSKITLTSKDGLRQVVDILAEVIQAAPKDAVQSAWGVTVGDNGTVSP